MKILNRIPLAQFSTLKIGGPAEYFCEVKSQAELIEAVAWAKAKRLPIHVLGNGSNTRSQWFGDQEFNQRYRSY